ncbi:MAG: hypothetical protein ACRDTA_04085 [Pseudonocardiaceae bacterium]
MDSVVRPCCDDTLKGNREMTEALSIETGDLYEGIREHFGGF